MISVIEMMLSILQRDISFAAMHLATKADGAGLREKAQRQVYGSLRNRGHGNPSVHA
ncbi:hypothetical protein [Polaromonas jejuensis]|uniref:Uncharacterized protein n=1 Tax=Polaromonas jejuensis TaxID=457502 RepID=A0ABW0Q7Q3_9BURK|nr:hypothetical protein [Polaromonas jejuensis]